MPSVLSEREYNLVYRILSEHQSNNQVIISSIEEAILPALVQKNNFLDIGPGTGFITAAIQDQFQFKSVVEPATEFSQHFAKLGFETQNTTFQQAVLTREYDYILCSHVLYSVDLDEWPAFLDKMLAAKSANGKCTVVMSAGHGKHHDMCCSINGNHKSSASVINYLRDKKIPHQVESVMSTYRATSFADMHALCRFSLLEDCFTPESYAALADSERHALEFKINAYAEQHHQPDGSYLLKAETDIIHI